MRDRFWLAFLTSLTALFLAFPAAAQTNDKLARQVTIYRDSFGVPHIFGKTDAAVVFGLMYAQCEDNFWQLETDLIGAVGRDAEVDGEKALVGDLLYRAFEVEKLAKEQYQRLPAKMRELCDAFAAGLNDYVARHPQIKPRLLTRFEPWFILAANLNGRLGGINRFGLRPSDIRIGTLESSSGTKTAQLDDATWQRWFVPSERESLEGSNMWVVGPSKSASGRAMLMMNPHVGFFGGGQRYEAHLHSEEGLNVYGFAILGTPYIRSGFNESLGWSHTNNYADIADVYLETFDDAQQPLNYRYGNGHRLAVEWTNEVKVKTGQGIETRRYRFRKTHHGPVIGWRDGKAWAARMPRLEGGELEQRFAMNRARNFNEFKAALARTSLTGSNTIYADREGNIFYIHGNAIPKRDPKLDWTKPMDGSDPATEWQGYHAFNELPQLLNPPAGFLQNCNSTPFLMTATGNPSKDQFPSYLAPEEDTPRAKSSRRILTEKPRLTFEEWEKAATDTKVNEAGPILVQMAAAWSRMKDDDPARHARLLEPARLLAEWDQRASADSVPTTLFLLLHRRLANAEADTQDKYPRWRKLEEVMAELEKNFGTWRVAWGDINRLQRIHTSGEEAFSDAKKSFPVIGGPGTAGMVFTYNTRAEKDQKRFYGTSGNTFTAVVEFGKFPRARSVLVFGQTADPNSTHYLDQAELYAQGKFKEVRFTLSEIKAHLERAYRPGKEVLLTGGR